MKEEIILNNLGLIHKAIKDLHCVYRNQEEYDNFYYAGLLGLIKASQTYDETKGKSTYLYNNICLRIKNVFRYNSNPKRHNGLAEVSLNIEIQNGELQDLIISNYNLEKEVLNKILIEDTLNKLKNRRYKTYIKEYYGIGTPQLNIPELALKYGVSKQCVQQTIKWGLELMRKEIK